MRVLILTALVALVSASPIGEEAAAATAAPSIPEAAPASEPVDIASMIDSRTLAEDQAQLAADQAQLAADQAQHAMDQARMFSEEALEQQKEKLAEQEAALKTAQAQLDGAIAQNAQLIAQSVYGNSLVPAIIPAPVPLVYSAPGLKIAEAKPEAPLQQTEGQAEKTEYLKAAQPEPAKAEPAKEPQAAPTAELGQIGLITAPLTIPGYSFPSMPLTSLTYTAPLTYYPPNLPVPYYQQPLVAAIPRAQVGL